MIPIVDGENFNFSNDHIAPEFSDRFCVAFLIIFVTQLIRMSAMTCQKVIRRSWPPWWCFWRRWSVPMLRTFACIWRAPPSVIRQTWWSLFPWLLLGAGALLWMPISYHFMAVPFGFHTAYFKVFFTLLVLCTEARERHMHGRVFKLISPDES